MTTTTTAIARMARAFALVAMMLSSFAVQAQPQPQDLGPDVDPPTRVARMSYASGRVSFSPAGNDSWVEARVNRPVVTGDRLWSDADSRVELAIDNSTWWLGDSTSLAVSNLDDRIVQMQVQEGVVDVRVRRLPADNVVEIDTPNLAFSVTRPGRYRVEVDSQDGSTLVVVRDGGGEVYGEGGSYVIASRQAYRFYGTDVADSEFVDLPPLDPFDRFAADRDRQYASAASLRYVSPDVVGYEDLDRYGAWSAEPTYGNVWFPRQVATDWAPYREGHWAWIDPWGWTWVDDEPWGFAPFHYGRWAHFERGWGWVPGPRTVRAVYAPALVAFIGGAGFSIAVSSGPAIGWFPLAPREVYVPPYRVSRNYFQQVNVTNTVVNVTNVTNIYNDPARVSQIRYANRAAPNAVTAVPPAAFAQAQNVRQAAVAVPAAAVQRAEVRAVAPVAPARPAFLGAAPAAQVKPPAAVVRRQVIAKAPPPPAPVSDAQKIQQLEKNPGRPLTRAEVQTLRRAAPAAEQATAPTPAKVVNPPKPAPNAAPPAQPAGTRRAQPAAGSPPAAGAPAAPSTERRAPNAPPTAGQGARPTPQPPAGAPQTPAPGAPAGPPAQRRAPNAPAAVPPPAQNERRAPPPREAPETQAPAAPPAPGTERATPPESRNAPRPPETGRRPEAVAPSRPPPAAGPAPQPSAAPPAPRPPEERAPPPQRRGPEARPQPQPQPEAAQRPEAPRGPPAQAARPAPAPQTESQPETARRPEAQRAPPPAARPAPAPPPQPEAARRPEPPRGPPPQEARPAPAPSAPAPQTARRPEPARPPPQAARPAPEQRPAEQRPNGKDEKGKDEKGKDERSGG